MIGLSIASGASLESGSRAQFLVAQQKQAHVTDKTTIPEVNYLLALGIIFGFLILYPVAQELARGEPLEVWFGNLVIGVSIMAAAPLVWMSETNPAMERFDRSDWVFLLFFLSWVVLGIGLYLSRYAASAPGGELIFAFFGAVGAVGMGYKFVSVRSETV